MSNKLLRNDPCFCGSGKKYKRCHDDVHPKSKGAHLIKWYANIDSKIKDFQESTGHNPPCHKGCFNCCYDDFSISEVEFELIMREMKKWNQEDVEQVFDRALAQCEEIKEKYPIIWENLEKDAHADISIFNKQFEDHGKIQRNDFPCPMLNSETKSCMVYDVRPVICRTFGTTHMEFNSYDLYLVCEYIPNSITHERTTPSIDREREDAALFTNLKTPTGQVAYLRPYPIYYWFKILYYRTGKKQAQYNHYDSPTNFDRPIEQADYFTLKGFNSI